MFDLISGTPGAEGAAGRCSLARCDHGEWYYYSGYFDFRSNTWTLRRQGSDERVRVSPAEVVDRRKPIEYKPQKNEKTQTEQKETRTQWWRLPDPPGQIKLED